MLAIESKAALKHPKAVRLARRHQSLNPLSQGNLAMRAPGDPELKMNIAKLDMAGTARVSRRLQCARISSSALFLLA
jgi:hypothetical protein